MVFSEATKPLLQIWDFPHSLSLSHYLSLSPSLYLEKHFPSEATKEKMSTHPTLPDNIKSPGDELGPPRAPWRGHCASWGGGSPWLLWGGGMTTSDVPHGKG